MAHIRSRKHAGTSHPRISQTLAALLTLAAPLAAHAQQAPADQTLPEVKVKATAEVPFKADTSENPKFTQPLLDTPQTVQVIKKEVLREQGAGSLMEALRNTPGITMQLGENGNTSAGDTFSMRGFSTQTATFVDGIRDLGAVTRDVFNLEQIEIAKGPAGADIGRGAASGYINLISKLPTRENTNMATVGFGTANKLRTTVDLNKPVGETGALRLNAMVSQGDVDKRNVVDNSGWAIAPSFTLGLGTPTRFSVFSQHVRQDNTPDGGLPTIGLSGYYNADSFLRAGGKVDRENFYGSVNDYEKVDADMLTAKIEHDLNNKTTVRNISRYGRTTMDRVTTGVNTGATGLISVIDGDPSSWTVNRSRQRVDQENEILANQTSITTEFDIGGFKHSFVGGLEFMYEQQKNLGFGTTTQTINGVSYTAISNPAANLYHPNPNDPLGVPYATGAYTDGNNLTAALYAFDTIEISPQWLLNGGLRFERYRTETTGRTIVTAGNNASYPGYTPGQLAPDSLNAADNLLSWKVGVVYKPAPNGSVYAAYANSFTPPGGANFVLSGTANNQNNSALDPQETDNIEFGTKWDLLDNQLNVTAAAFRTENSKQTSFDDIGNPTQMGRTRVQGVELAAVGQLNNFWQVSAGITRMNAKALEQQSAAGVETAGVRWTPELTATLWTSYTFGDFTLGGGARYVSDQKRVVTVNTAPAAGLSEIPSYWAADAMAAYKVNKNVNLRLNVYNLFDEEYIETLNNGGGRVKFGLPRSAMMTAEFTF